MSEITIHVMSRARAYVFTWNNYPDDHDTLLLQLGARYVLYGRELAPGTGTPHLQGYVYWRSAKTAAATRGMLPGCHVEPARGSFQQNYDYCSKGGNYVAHGDPPMDDKERGDGERARYVQAWTHAKLGRMEEIDADIRVRFYTTLKRIERDFMPAVANLPGVCGLWITGVSGSGKTRSVLRAFPQAYIKPRNIWWDGYQGEEIVLCDDVDKFDVRLGGHFKHWADFAAFIAECKGGAQRIRPAKFIVTSQYKIEDVWSDAETRAALARRFTRIDKYADQDIILI